MKHIILPTDFSENAANASRYALRLFENESCTFHIVNCYAPFASHHSIYATALNLDAPDNINLKKSEQGLEKFVASIKDLRQPWHFFKTLTSPRLLTNELMHLITETNTELVIMGTKGASGLKEIFMGSNTVQVIKAIKNCPVLAIPENYDFTAPLEIAFATDLYRFYSESELQPVIDLAKAFKSAVRIINVTQKEKTLSDVQEFNLREIQKQFGEIQSTLHSVPLTNSISKTLELFTEELGVHLLALLNYPHSYLEKIKRESVVKNIAFHTQIPLLVVPEMTIGTGNKKWRKSALVAG